MEQSTSGEKMKNAKKTCKMCIVKRAGHTEEFDEKKAYGLVYWAARSSHLSEKEAESIAEKVTKALKKWVDKKKEIDSDKIFEFLCSELRKHNGDVAFMYETHRDIA